MIVMYLGCKCVFFYIIDMDNVRVFEFKNNFIRIFEVLIFIIII